jgi:hypothetical protein
MVLWERKDFTRKGPLEIVSKERGGEKKDDKNQD